MKSYRIKAHFSRRGATVLLSVFLLAMTSSTIAIGFLERVSDQYLAVRSSADGFRAQQLALSGFQAGIAAIKDIPEEFLFTSGVALSPPEIELGRHCREEDSTLSYVVGKDETCLIYRVSYIIQPEDGKLNLNNLVRNDDLPNENYRQIVRRLFFRLDLPQDNTDPIIDWIDENTYVEGDGAEHGYYEGLNPPQSIKNFRMFSLSELGAIKGFSHDMIYGSRAREGWKEELEQLASLSEDEKNLVTEEDWYLANNVTAFMPFNETTDDKVNINAARFNVLMSLSDSMTREAVLALFKLRRKNKGYIKNLAELQHLPEFQVPSVIPGLNLYQELAGSGGEISGMIKTEGAFYRIVGVGTLVLLTDNGEERTLATRTVWGIWDKSNRRLVYYTEE